MRPVARAARLDDLPELTRIYNHYVRTSGATFDLEEQSLEARRAWLDEHAATGPHRLLVAEESGRLLGWSSSGPLRPRPAYARSVETSVYLDPAATGRGLGSLLGSALLEALDGENLGRWWDVRWYERPLGSAGTVDG